MVHRIKNKHLLATAALLLSSYDHSCCNAFTNSHQQHHQHQHFHAKRPLSSISTFSSSSSSSSPPPLARTRRTSSNLNMESSIKQKDNAALSSSSSTPLPNLLDNLQHNLLPVVWTSLLITSNTVGAGMLVLPELCEGPGMGVSMGLFLAMYLLNLISGMWIAEVAITQKLDKGQDAPSSFKAFAEENLDNPLAKDVIAAVCVIKNALVLAFGTMKAGQLGHDVLGLDADLASVLWVLIFAGLLGTQSAPRLSKVASVFVAGLFSSFATILIPGLAHMQTPVMDLLQMPGTSSDPMADLMHAAPIILMSFIFQNIVPTTARILDYDRTKIALSMAIGTFFPFGMYAAWCMAVLGGGVDTAVGLDGPMFTLFSVVTIAGSHLGSSTSMSEELDTYLRGSETPDEDRKEQVFSWASVLITAALAIGLGEGFAGNLNDLLSIAGAYGSPFLYFVLPLVMMKTQQDKLNEPSSSSSSLDKELLIPSPGWDIPNIPLAMTATAATGFVGLQTLHMLF